MLYRIKQLIKSITPGFALSWYHLTLAMLANFYYRRPSERLIVIGVTGTNGKSTTVNLIAKIFDEAGIKSCATSTVNFKMGDQDRLNDRKMTMPGRFFIQKFLAQAVNEDCRVAIIESSSEGVLQYRHFGNHYDGMVFTNLTPEHIEAHGGFENYKNAKLTYFKQLERLPKKILDGREVKKVIAINVDDQYANDFNKFKVDKTITYGTKNADITGSELVASPQGINFKINGQSISLKLKGKFDFYNSLAAVAITSGFGVSLETAIKALEKIENVPGRMEILQTNPFTVIVDYAPEPESLRQLYSTIQSWPKNKIIHLLGSTGGGRDVGRRKILGNLAGKNADIVIVTNEDPYDDDPQQIIHDVADGAVEVGKVIKESLFREPDRRKAIAKAFSLAQAGDLVLLTGKGSEQKMAVKGGYIDWDDRKVAKEELQKMK